MRATLRPSPSSLDDLVRRVRGEFLEMPGLHLTREQARRLWALDDPTCTSILDALVEVQFLVRQADGQYSRPTERTEPLLRMIKADIRRQPADPRLAVGAGHRPGPLS